ncbi:type II toxin-antitoxin system HicB family antitoxin [Synechocystis salina LEGE 06155]|nr:type II toxin-antitoxin system HicB family antitoxin [Synechocystis salina LEGE 06155]
MVWHEQDQWCASVPALPGCYTWGDCYDHLIEMVKEAVEG